MYAQSVRYSPVGEYIRLVVLQRLAEGPAKVEELNELAKEAVERAGVRYDWRIWPELVKREVAIKDGVAELTAEGRWLLEKTKDIVVDYVRRTLGVSLS